MVKALLTFMYTVSMMQFNSEHKMDCNQNTIQQLSDADARNTSYCGKIENNTLHNNHKRTLHMVERSNSFKSMACPYKTTASPSRLTDMD